MPVIKGRLAGGTRNTIPFTPHPPFQHQDVVPVVQPLPASPLALTTAVLLLPALQSSWEKT